MPSAMMPMLVLPLVRGPSEAGSGSTALRNSSGAISASPTLIGSMLVMPTFSSTLRWVMYLSEKVIQKRMRFRPLMFWLRDSSSSW